MDSYLVSLSSDHDSDKVVERAISDAAAAGARLVAVFVARPRREIGVAERLTESSSLSPRLSRETAHEIKKTTLKVGLKRLAEVQRLASERAVECETDIINGAFDEQTLNAAVEKGASRIYISADHRGILSRIFFQSEVDEVADRARCEVIIV